MKSVLITGASSGIGAALARAAGRKGWNVIIGYRSGIHRATALAEEIQSAGGKGFPVHVDLLSIPHIERNLESLAQAMPSLDALVLCGAPPPILKMLTKQTTADLLEPFTAGVLASQALITACWRIFFKKAGQGHIVGVLSEAAGSPPSAQMEGYVIAKRGMQALLECAAVELGKGGLRVSAISPSYTETPMLAGLNPHFVEAARATTPAQRFLKPSEVAEQILHQLENPPEPGDFRLDRIPATAVFSK